MGNAGELTRDLAQRAPGHALIEKLLEEWDQGRIHLGDSPDTVVIDDEARGWYWGVLGERRVADILSGLGEGWATLHSIPVGSGSTDIDHIVIGPAGVFTINTKYSPGSAVWSAGHGLLVNGFSKAQFLRNTLHEVTRVTAILSDAVGFPVPVTGVIAFVAPGSMTRNAPADADGVTVLVRSDVELRNLTLYPQVFSDEQVTQLVDTARVLETWSQNADSSRIGTHISREFDALRAAVGPALDSTRPEVAITGMGGGPRPSTRVPRSRPAQTYRRTPRSRPTRSRRRGRSIGEDLLRLAVAAAGLFGVWYFFTNVYGK